MEKRFRSDDYGANVDPGINGNILVCCIFSNSKQPDFKYGAEVTHEGIVLTPETYRPDATEILMEPPITIYQQIGAGEIRHELQLRNEVINDPDLVQAMVVGVTNSIFDYYMSAHKRPESGFGETALYIFLTNELPNQQLVIATLGMILGEIKDISTNKEIELETALLELKQELPQTLTKDEIRIFNDILKIGDTLASLGFVNMLQACDKCPIRRPHIIQMIRKLANAVIKAPAQRMNDNVN